MARYFTSDLHFDHHNVIEYCKRPWHYVTEMNWGLVDNWNSVVTEEDEVIHIGDWCLNPRGYLWIPQLRFKKLIMIRGNHDRFSKLANMLATDERLMYLQDKVVLLEHLDVEIGGMDFYCVHRPLQASDIYPTLCGHVHERWQFMMPGAEIGEHSRNEDKVTKVLKQPVLNVGCDVHGYKPISEAQVLEFFK